MQTIFVLLVGSAVTGFVVGLRFRVYVIAVVAPVLAAVAAIAVRDFGFVAAAGITFACLTVSQIAYVLASWLSVTYLSALFGHKSDDHSRKDGQSSVPRNHNKQDRPPSYLVSY